MPAPGAPIARLVRALGVSVLATLMALVAHVAGAGEPPPAVSVVPVVMAGGALAWSAAARRIGLATALALLAAPQLGVHLLAAYVHGHAPMPSSARMLLAHAVGVAVVGAAIATADRLWWASWQRVAAVMRLAHPDALPPSGAAPARRRVLRGLEPELLAHVLVRRGPPFSRFVVVPVARARG